MQAAGNSSRPEIQFFLWLFTNRFMSTLWCSGGPFRQKSAFHFCIHSQARGYQSEFCLKKKSKLLTKTAKKVWSLEFRPVQKIMKKKKEKKNTKKFFRNKKHCYSSSSYLCAFPKNQTKNHTISKLRIWHPQGSKTSIFWSRETRSPGMRIRRDFFFIPWVDKSQSGDENISIPLVLVLSSFNLLECSPYFVVHFS